MLVTKVRGDMVQQNIESRIKDIVAQVAGVPFDHLNEKTLFREYLDFDSLDITELVIELEEEFDITITDGESEKFAGRPLGDWIELVKKKLQ